MPDIKHYRVHVPLMLCGNRNFPAYLLLPVSQQVDELSLGKGICCYLCRVVRRVAPKQRIVSHRVDERMQEQGAVLACLGWNRYIYSPENKYRYDIYKNMESLCPMALVLIPNSSNILIIL